MTQNSQTSPPSSRKLLWSVVAAAVAVAVVLVVVMLPSGNDAQRVQVGDPIGGNEDLAQVAPPDPGEPTPLPNPNVHQDEPERFRTETLEVALGPEQQTEVKTVLREGKMVVYSWEVDRGDVYVDYHGHDPALGDDFWVRYKEQQEGTGNHGSLVAPFDGEHGWYWLNYNDFPVTITLTVAGYYDDIIDYGIF